MRSAHLFLITLLVCPASAQLSAAGVSLMQSKLRGSQTSTVTIVSSPEVDVPEPSAVAEKQPEGEQNKQAGQRFSDDDESCTAEGITPGICALASLAKPSPFDSVKKVRHGAVAECDDQESTDRLERALIAEIGAGLSGKHTGFDATRLEALEEELKPIYATLPHGQYFGAMEAGLELSSARYLLHQHFLRQHSWYVRGLNPAGDGRKPPDHREALRSRVAGHLLEVLENKVGEQGKQGLSLKTLAVFVATLEHLIHGDERQRLKQAWAVHDLSPEDVTDESGLQNVLEVFMAHYVYVSTEADSGYALTLEKAQQEVRSISKVYGGWKDLVSFIQEQVKKQADAGISDFGLEDAAKASQVVLEFFRDVSGSMCRDMETAFGNLPGGNAGRILVKDMARSRHFGESIEYLRKSHSLDEAPLGETGNTYVLVPNYMLGASNCDGTTSFYDLCCPNECEEHKAHIEKALAPQELWAASKTLTLYSGKSLSAVSAIKDAVQQRLGSPVPEDLLGQLERLAQEHGGRIPMHGLEFATWLHRAFPRQCPRPVASDFKGTAGDAVPDSQVEFQDAAESLLAW